MFSLTTPEPMLSIDRFKFEEGSTPAAVWTMTQESLTSGNAYTAGFTKALKIMRNDG